MNYPCGEAPKLVCNPNACESCGFNPDEAKRRLDEGEFIKDERGIYSLHFKRKEKENDETD